MTDRIVPPESGGLFVRSFKFWTSGLTFGLTEVTTRAAKSALRKFGRLENCMYQNEYKSLVLKSLVFKPCCMCQRYSNESTLSESRKLVPSSGLYTFRSCHFSCKFQLADVKNFSVKTGRQYWACKERKYYKQPGKRAMDLRNKSSHTESWEQRSKVVQNQSGCHNPDANVTSLKRRKPSLHLGIVL